MDLYQRVVGWCETTDGKYGTRLGAATPNLAIGFRVDVVGIQPLLWREYKAFARIQ